MVSQAGRPVYRIELMKWAFLLASETSSQGGDTFYSFVPYKYGPFSFGLYYDIIKLVNQKILSSVNNTIRIPDCIENRLIDLEKSIQVDINSIVERFKGICRKDLVDYVYHHYPYYTANSTKCRLFKIQAASPAVYTAGYEGLQIDGFLNSLIEKGIKCIIDVRKNPLARRYGFHGSTLHRLCVKLGLEYLHFPELGIQSVLRKELVTPSDYAILFKFYENNILKKNMRILNKIAPLLFAKPCVLVCMEADSNFCHRSQLAKVLSEKTALKVIHLELLNDIRTRSH